MTKVEKRMRVKNSVEQAICLLIIIAHGKNEEHIKSYFLSQRLDVSDSYLKKIIRQLVVAGLINSEAGKNGGFTLKKDPAQITLCDIFEAIEGKEAFAVATGLVEKVFLEESAELKATKQKMILNAFEDAEEAFKAKLRAVTLKMAMKDYSEG